MKKIVFAFFILLFFCLPPVFANVDFEIRFYNRQIYYVEEGDIELQVIITNNTGSTYRFRLADDRIFSIDFDVRTLTNQQVRLADSFMSKRTNFGLVSYREVAIEPGQSISFTENLRNYIAFSQPGSYRVRARIYPELVFTHAEVIESNYLTFTIRPATVIGPDGIAVNMDVATGAALVKQRMPPDEVIRYMLEARQREDWERFFLYLDLESMLSRDPNQRRRWLVENEEGRIRMVETYRQNLRSSTFDGDINVKPDDFEILRTFYENNEGQVIARLRFRYPTYTQIRQYTYYLEKRDNFWILVNYTVQGMGTE